MYHAKLCVVTLYMYYYTDVNLLSNNKNTIKENTEALSYVTEVNTKNNEYAVLSHHHDAWTNNNMNEVDKSLQNVAKLKYLEMLVTNKICIHK